VSESTRLKNEAIDQAREEGRLEPTPKTEPGASLANAQPITNNFAELADVNASNIPREPATPAPTRPPITAAQQYDPIEALPKRQPVNDGPNMASTGGQSQIKSDALKKVFADLRAEQGLNHPPEPEAVKILDEHDPTPVKTPFTNAVQDKPAETYQERLSRVTNDIRAEEGLPPRGSQMVQDQSPAPRPSNTMPEAKAEDAQAFNKEWNNEQAQAAAYQERINDAREKAKEENDNDKGQDRGQEQGMSR